MKKQFLIGTVSIIMGVSLLLWLPRVAISDQDDQHPLQITTAWVDYSGGYLYIFGSNFGKGVPIVFLGKSPLQVSAHTSSMITAVFPSGITDGEYLLSVSAGNAPSQNATTPLIIGVLNVEGPQGPKGDKGDTGPTGSQGPKGDTGPAGAQGAQGPAGAQGPPGSVVVQGVIGPTGPAGPPGVTSAQATTLQPGSPATATLNGSLLTIGVPQGPAGANGPTGATGAAGATGAQGPAGVIDLSKVYHLSCYGPMLGTYCSCTAGDHLFTGGADCTAGNFRSLALSRPVMQGDAVNNYGYNADGSLYYVSTIPAPAAGWQAACFDLETRLWPPLTVYVSCIPAQ